MSGDSPGRGGCLFSNDARFAASSKPFFGSLAVFESDLVNNTDYVSPGAPAKSELILLMKGEGTGAFKQMPTGGDPFAVKAGKDQTQITMAELEEWIVGMGK